MTPLQANEIRLMERAGRLAADVLNYVCKQAKAGMTTKELDLIAHGYILSKDATPAPLNYNGFPNSICTSVNSCICHGVPSEYVLKDGDSLNVDVTVIKDGFHGDTSKMVFIGEVSQKAKDLADCAFNAMHRGIEAVKAGGTTGDIGFATNKYVMKKGFFVVRDIGGHGIGRTFHDDPFVPAYGKKGRGPVLKPWCCITVEPMVNETDAAIIELPIAGSTIKYYETADKSLSAQYEHTVLITDNGPQILTLDE